jgi:hypothetical protein
MYFFQESEEEALSLLEAVLQFHFYLKVKEMEKEVEQECKEDRLSEEEQRKDEELRVLHKNYMVFSPTRKELGLLASTSSCQGRYASWSDFLQKCTDLDSSFDSDYNLQNQYICVPINIKNGYPTTSGTPDVVFVFKT